MEVKAESFEALRLLRNYVRLPQGVTSCAPATGACHYLGWLKLIFTPELRTRRYPDSVRPW